MKNENYYYESSCGSNKSGKTISYADVWDEANDNLIISLSKDAPMEHVEEIAQFLCDALNSKKLKPRKVKKCKKAIALKKEVRLAILDYGLTFANSDKGELVIFGELSAETAYENFMNRFSDVDEAELFGRVYQKVLAEVNEELK